MGSQVTQELVEKYLDLTSRAKEKATPIHSDDTPEGFWGDKLCPRMA